ncbi:MAG: undecaprenyldiphospho-muramoylpentapeptide beta-N-acetylglucosaminyltransferase [Acidimicrobiia bacterium]|nr:undecaprenyldiphospho-muramoylpentapeptide beta-N-acetylglucosaminyltransferase [Acidimicrobiia bacterium]NNF11220.1 undecaprenyldiphospho-muramoylpentapeptide beta-N-acetylglucosaminyltransferase [Acidimicrobiia bacterium]NNL68956.1 undecaprenyldiphospho-muramoylpentapeptide beta-N-acetylglucosaminyltransferase [Acidimicrobiia bacterium]
MTIAIAAAGTGGHVFPALAVAEALHVLGVARSDVVFFGGDRLEARVVPAAGYELIQLRMAGLARSFSLRNARVVGQLLAAARAVRRQIRDRHVTAVLAMGGYITGPAAIAARRAGVPLLIHEQNAVPGRANRWAARWADSVFVAFPAAQAALTRAEVVGNPLRADLVTRVPSRVEALDRYGLSPDRPVIGILGGSQGAAVLNVAAAALAGGGSQLLHLAGPDQHTEWTARAAGESHWHVVPFEDQMGYFYAAADVAIARAGALTVSELAVTGTPSILVPYPGAGGHQRANAAFLVDAGGAVLLDQEQLDRLPAVVEAALVPEELARRRAAARAVGKPDAAGRVAAAVLEAAGA